MIGRKWVVASLFAAVALVAGAAGTARADDHRWSLGRAQWQPPTHAGWFNNNRDGDRNQWDRGRDSHREREPWWRRHDDDRRWDRRDHDRGRHLGWWRRDHRPWRD